MLSFRSSLKCFGLQLFVAAICTLSASPVLAKTYYVSASTGNDAQDGTSPSTPWKTLSKVNSSVFEPGDSVLFKRGDIWSLQRLIITWSGTSVNPITFGAYDSGPRPKFDGQQNAKVFWGVRIQNRSWIVVDGLEVYRFNKGLAISNSSSNIIVRNSIINFIGGECIGASTFVSNITFENNVVHDCGVAGKNGEGIYIGTDPAKAGGIPDRTTSIVIRNNEIYNTTNEAIELKPGTSACTVQNNWIHDVADATNGAVHAGHWVNPLIIPDHLIDSNKIYNVPSKPGITIRGGRMRVSRNVVYNAKEGIRIVDTHHTRLVAEIYNNTFYKNAGNSISIENSALVNAKNNLSWFNGSGNLSYDPLFANASGGDFRLCEGVGSPLDTCKGRSPAIGAGVQVGLPFSGTAPSLGAIESAVTQMLPAPPVGLRVQRP